jgi:hypothetical protein
MIRVLRVLPTLISVALLTACARIVKHFILPMDAKRSKFRAVTTRSPLRLNVPARHPRAGLAKARISVHPGDVLTSVHLARIVSLEESFAGVALFSSVRSLQWTDRLHTPLTHRPSYALE